MKPIYEVDFSALSPEEKLRFVYDIGENARAGFQGAPLETQLLAQTLIFTRWWNSYRHMSPQEPAPEVLEQAIELLWDYLEGKCPKADFCRFQKSFDDSCVDILTGDDSGLSEDPKSEAFYQAHFARWDFRFYNVFFSALDSVLMGAAQADDIDLGWDALVDVIDGDIGDTMVVFFTPICTTLVRYTVNEIDHRNQEVYSTPIFARVIALLQRDMRAALEGTPLPVLRERYRDEYLFSPEECAKISGRL